jgi:hypothetical protein
VRLLRASLGLSRVSFVPSGQLIGDVIEVVADDLRLRANPQNIVADALDQRGLPAGRHGAERVPGMAGDHAELRRVGPELPFDICVNLPRRLMVLHPVRTEVPLEENDDAACST